MTRDRCDKRLRARRDVHACFVVGSEAYGTMDIKMALLFVNQRVFLRNGIEICILEVVNKDGLRAK